MRRCVKSGQKAVKSKDRGATMVFALVIFLIAAMMSMVIVNAALGNAARLRRAYEKRQAMLAISSAENLVEGMIHGLSARKNSSGWEIYFGKSDIFKGESSDQLKEKLKGMISGTSATTTLHISSSMSSSDIFGRSDESDPLAVDVELKCNTNKDYAIEAKITRASYDEDDYDEDYGKEDGGSTSKTYTFPAITIEINESFTGEGEEGERADTGNPSFIQW